MPVLRQLTIDNVVFVMDRKFLDNFRFPPTPRLERLHLAVRPVAFTIGAVGKFRAENVVLKFIAKNEDVIEASQTLCNKFQTLRSLEMDCVSLLDWLERFSSLESIIITSSATLDEKVFKIDRIPTGALKIVKLRIQAPSPGMIRRFFGILRPSDALQRLAVAWNSEEAFMEELVDFRIKLGDFRFTVSSNGMGFEASREEGGVRSFRTEFSAMVKCRCLQCRLQEVVEHTQLIADFLDLSDEAAAFYEDHCGSQ
jgi:hypothetical protein